MPRPWALSYHRITARHPGRFPLGPASGTPKRPRSNQRPYAALVRYPDQLDDPSVLAEGRVLAALGPRVPRLSAERAAGAHPYPVTPEHTRQARQISRRRAAARPEQKLVLRPTRSGPRHRLQPAVQNPYLGLTNYLSNLRRLGWTDADFADGGSDALIDALAVHGDAAAIARGVTAHLKRARTTWPRRFSTSISARLRALAGQLQLAPR
jgi:probable F420-dependent oxidoreductase